MQFESRGRELVANEVEQSLIILRTESETAKALVGNPIYHSRTKQILAKYHYIRDRVVEGETALERVKSEMDGVHI